MDSNETGMYSKWRSEVCGFTTETEGCVADFKANEGPKLQQVLEDRAKQHRNWVSARGWIEGQQEGSITGVFFFIFLI